jgi:hypothetical protein
VKRLVLGLTTLALLAGCGGGGGDEATVSLAEQNGSGQSGEVILTKVDDSTTRVEVSITAPPADDPQPAHIHKGSCEDLDPNPAYGLENVVDGSSSSEVEVSLDELTDGAFAVNVHKSGDELDVYVACGDIGSGAGGTETGSDDGYSRY